MTGSGRIAGGLAKGIAQGIARTVLGFGLLAPAGAFAGPYTGTGGGPETTANAPYRAPSGQTVPPGRDAAPDADPTERTQRQKRLDGVLDSICTTCRDEAR